MFTSALMLLVFSYLGSMTPNSYIPFEIKPPTHIK